MAFTTQYIICNISIVKYMYSLFEILRSEVNSEPLRWNIKDGSFCENCSQVRPINYFCKNLRSDVPLSLNTTLLIASPYQLSQRAKQLTYSLIKLLLAPSQSRQFLMINIIHKEQKQPVWNLLLFPQSNVLFHSEHLN